MNQFAAGFARFQNPAEADRMRFRHVGSHDQHAIAVGEIALKGGRRSASERGAQTGHRGAMSNASLVFDRENPEPAREELLDEIVFLVVEGSAAQVRDGLEVIEFHSVGGRFDEIAVASVLHQVCEAVHGPIERTLLPMVAVRRAVHDSAYPMRIRDQLESICALGAERALVNWAIRVALDIDYLAALGVHVLAASDGTVRANTVRFSRTAQ